MDLAEFDFDLPEERIALRPMEPRDAARLLVVHGDGRLDDHYIRDLPDLLGPDVMMVFNDTRVLQAALKGKRPARLGGGSAVEVDINLIEKLPGRACWRVLARPGRRLRIGDLIEFTHLRGESGPPVAEVRARHQAGEIDLDFSMSEEDFASLLNRIGDMPLPPYIAKRRAADARDKRDYQTCFAKGRAGSVAAPTAGLHFTPNLLDRLTSAGIPRTHVRLNVGLGTFAPLRAEQVSSHKLHEETRTVRRDVATHLNAFRAAGGRCLSVGTTAMRTLESASDSQGIIHAVDGPTDLFIRPGDPIRATDMLLTNFHLPKSSLFMLVSALMGTDQMQAAYRHAIDKGYRFYSYGDACLLLP